MKQTFAAKTFAAATFASGAWGGLGVDAPSAPAPGPAIPFRPWLAGADPISPTPGVGNFAACIPVVECLSAGPPPVAPDLVEELGQGWMNWRRGCRSGQVVSGPLATEARATFRVRWTGLTKGERNSVVAFLRDEVEGVRFAFDLAADGPGTTPAAKVRPLREAVSTWVNRVGYGVDVEVEEVFS